MITGDHIRMIRGALRLSIRQFASMAGVANMTVSTLERGAKAQTGTQEKIREAFAQYVEFIEPIEGVRGAGIMLKWGIEPIGDSSDNDGENDISKRGKDSLHSHAWDEDFNNTSINEADLSDDERQWLHYIRTNPNLSERGRDILLKAIHQ